MSSDVYENRDDFKVKVFAKIFIAEKTKIMFMRKGKNFRKLFPNVADIIKHYKKDDYKNLAIQLQRAEANIIIHKIIPQIAKENIWAVTIHDSVLTTQKDANQSEADNVKYVSK
ncbi:MAG: hypothetical protein U5K00_12180 [Melioribacteraceae bacterium]|nr:hypothetical protein [Melioribacteraceae bacterium]